MSQVPAVYLTPQGPYKTYVPYTKHQQILPPHFYSRGYFERISDRDWNDLPSLPSGYFTVHKKPSV